MFHFSHFGPILFAHRKIYLKVSEMDFWMESEKKSPAHIFETTYNLL